MPPSISVCVASVRAETLGATIASIQRQTDADWELLIVGQGRDPALRSVGESAMSADRRIRYIHSDRRGLSLARNIAIQRASGGIIAMTDDDCEPAADWLAAIRACFEADPTTGLVGGPLRAPPKPRGWLVRCPAIEPADAIYDPLVEKGEAPPGWEWVGANFACRRDVMERAGPFDEYLGAGSIFRACEDTDYKLRLEAIGARMRSTPRVVVNHTYGARSGLRAVLRITGAYATGNGALAAKLTLMGDSRGKEWLAGAWRDCLRRLPLGWRHFALYRAAYQRCLREFAVDPRSGVLRPRAASETMYAASRTR
jgi:GT2 family glycosyltransferase